MNTKKLIMATIAIFLPLFANADDSGLCGENVTWFYEEATHTLTISGTGNMYDYIAGENDHSKSSPWFYLSGSIYNVSISHGVTSIGNDAFYRCRLTSVSIPNSITSIGNGAFGYCSLSSIVIPNSVTSIGIGAFECSGLTSFEIPGSVRYIGERAFMDCNGLVSVTVNGGLTCIGYETFSSCTGITHFNVVVSDQAAFCSNEVVKVLYGSLYKPIHLLDTEGNEITDYIIPEGVTEIGDYAFFTCKGLETVHIPNSVTSIGEFAFDGCSNITSINIPDGVKLIGYSAFNGCNNVISISIPSSLSAISDFSFSSMGLTTVTIPNNVKSIGEASFFGCDKLTSVIIGNEVQSIGRDAFVGCSGLNDVYCLGTTAPNTYNSFDKDEVKNATLHVKDVAFSSFEGVEPWTYFKEIVSENVTYFNLTYYVDGEIYKQYKHKRGEILLIEPNPEKEEYTFSGWSEIPDTMPATDVNVYGTFIPTEILVDGITYRITNGEAVIISCSKTNGDLIIPSSVEDRGHEYLIKTIPSNIFNGKGFASLTIQNGVETIEARAFYGCSDLVTVVVPSTITSIGERAFANIDNMETFTCKTATIPNTHRTAFENSYTDYVDLYVPEESVADYSVTGPWSSFKSVIGIVDAKCKTPTISIVSGKLVFSCDTPDVEYHYSITAGGATSGVGNDIPLSSTYAVTVYATRENYDDSEPVTMELHLSHGDLNGDGSLSISDAVSLVNLILNKNE